MDQRVLVITASLQHADCGFPVLRQAVGEDAAGSTGADNDVVEGIHDGFRDRRFDGVSDGARREAGCRWFRRWMLRGGALDVKEC